MKLSTFLLGLVVVAVVAWIALVCVLATVLHVSWVMVLAVMVLVSISAGLIVWGVVVCIGGVIYRRRLRAMGCELPRAALRRGAS